MSGGDEETSVPNHRVHFGDAHLNLSNLDLSAHELCSSDEKENSVQQKVADTIQSILRVIVATQSHYS